MSKSQTQLYFYSSEGLALIKHNSAGATALLRAASQALAQRDIGKTALYALDGQGSVLHFSACSVKYTVYGGDGDRQCASVLRYGGQRKEPLTGHYLLGEGYRALNPNLMRLQSPDSWSPMGNGGLNCYAYCGGDPVNYTDPSGHIKFHKIAKAPSLQTIWERPEAPKPKKSMKLSSVRKHAGVAEYTVSEHVVNTINDLGRGYGGQIQPIMNSPNWSKADKLLVQGTTLQLQSQIGRNLMKAGVNTAAISIPSNKPLMEAFATVVPLNDKMQVSGGTNIFADVVSWLHGPGRKVLKVRDPGKTG